MDNYATGVRATGYRRRGRHRSENPNQNRDFWQNSGQNRQWEADHVENLGWGRSFRDPATPHSAVPRGNSGDGGRGSGGRGRGGRGGAHYVPQQPNSESDATTAYAATMDASRRARRPTINSFPMSTASSGSSTTSVIDFPGAQNRHRRSRQRLHEPAVCRLLYALATFIGILYLVINNRFNEIGDFLKVVNRHRRSHQRWRTEPAVCQLLFVLATFVIILFLVIKDRFNELGDFLKVVADLKNLMLSG